MDAWAWGALLAPVGALIIFGGIALPIKWLIATYMKDGWLKRQILAERFKSKCSSSTRRVLEQAARHPMGWRGFITNNNRPITGLVIHSRPAKKQ